VPTQTLLHSFLIDGCFNLFFLLGKTVDAICNFNERGELQIALARFCQFHSPANPICRTVQILPDVAAANFPVAN
jgi:hypothetical protein